jgi:hypothetical protein
MIRKNLFIIFFISSCTNVDLGYINLLSDRFSGNKISDLKPYYDTGYSFIRISRARNQAIFILGDYDNGLETWYGPQKEVIQTYKGLIISSDKLPFNIRLHNLQINEFPFEQMSYGYITLLDPRADYLELKFIKVDSGSNDDCQNYYSYERFIPSIRDKQIFYFCYDSSGKTIYSRQKSHPLDEEIFIEYFYQ